MTDQERAGLNEHQRQRYDSDVMDRGIRGMPPLTFEQFKACNPALFDADYVEPNLPEGMKKRVDIR